MSATVLAFRGRRPRPRPVSPLPPCPLGGDVYLIEAARGGWLVADSSPSGGSAGTHGWHADRADAVVEARKLASAIGGTFHDGEPRGVA